MKWNIQANETDAIPRSTDLTQAVPIHKARHHRSTPHSTEAPLRVYDCQSDQTGKNMPYKPPKVTRAQPLKATRMFTTVQSNTIHG